MSAAEIISEIVRLPADERDEVTRFVREFRAGRKLSAEELGELAKRLVDSDDPAEVAALKNQIIAGFYGD